MTISIACVAGVWKGRERELVLGARETRGGRAPRVSLAPKPPSFPFQTPVTQATISKASTISRASSRNK